MKYKTAKKKLKAAGDAYDKAKVSFEEAKDDLQDAKAEQEMAYESLTQTMAEQTAGDATKKDVKKAKKAHKQAKQAVNDTQVTVDAKAKAIQVFEDKMETIRPKFRRAAVDHYKKKSQPIIKNMIDALENLKDINQQVKQFRSDVDDAGLSPTEFIPMHFEKITLPVRHLKRGISLQQWKEQVETIKENVDDYKKTVND